MFERKGYIIGQQFMKFFLPTVLMTMALSLSTVVDGMIVGNILGPDALAAVNLVLPVTLLFNTVYVLFGVGGSTLFSVALGERDHERARQLFTVSVGAMVVTAVMVLFIGLFLCRHIAQGLTGNAPNLTELVYQYIRVVMLAAPFLIVVPGLVYFLRSSGAVRIASSTLIVANLVNLALDIIFIVIFHSGIGGAALATACGYLVGLLIALWGIRRSKELRFSKKHEHPLRMAREMAGTGLPSAVNTSLNFFRLTSINAIVMMYLGSDGVTAFSVCTSCLSIVSMFISGSAQTMIPLLGTLHGEKDTAGIRFTIRKAIFIFFSSTLLLLLMFETVPAQITALFGVTAPAQVSIAVEAIRIFALSLPFTGILFLFMCVYQVLGYRKLSNMIALLEGFAIVVPAAWLLARLFGPHGIWWAFLIGELLTLAVLGGAIAAIRSKHRELTGVFLLEKAGQDKMLDVTMIQTDKQATDLSSQAIQFCKENQVPELTANKVGVALEEMAVNTVLRNRKADKKAYIDVRLIMDEECILISFRDNGPPFNPLEKKDEAEEFDNINVAIAMSSEISYDNILGMNCSMIKIKRENERSMRYE